MSEKTFSLAEVAKHNSEGDIWIVVDRVVYDLTKFLKLHPGGKQVLLQYAGKDVSNIFFVYHHASVLKKYGPRLRIGVLEGPPPKKVEIPGTFGEMVPYGDPIWYQRFNTPYYKETHRQWRKLVREFTDKRVIETMDGWRDADEPPKDILQEMGKLGLLAIMNCRPWPTQYLDAGVPMPENPDYFHELIFYDEIARCGSSSVVAALTNGPAIALPVILKFGSEELKRRVAPDVLMGRKTIALAVSEPQAGSDVAGMVCTAQRQGDYYIVNGNKKWITNGTYADFFVTAVVTGKPGHQGISFLLIDKDTPGFGVRKLQIRDSNISGTAYLDFDNCKVPVGNLIGKENEGFKLVMYNFNHERLYVSAVCCRLARVCLEESVKYASKRTTFGKPLSDHQSIRMKIASMTRQVESLQNWLDFVTYQLTTMSHEEANIKVGDVLSLVKAQASKVYEHCSRETTMIFGGNALYMTGVGRKIEPSVVQVKGYQIPAGAEDVMDDFAARAAFKKAQLLAKL